MTKKNLKSPSTKPKNPKLSIQDLLYIYIKIYKLAWQDPQAGKRKEAKSNEVAYLEPRGWLIIGMSSQNKVFSQALSSQRSFNWVMWGSKRVQMSVACGRSAWLRPFFFTAVAQVPCENLIQKVASWISAPEGSLTSMSKYLVWLLDFTGNK